MKRMMLLLTCLMVLVGVALMPTLVHAGYDGCSQYQTPWYVEVSWEGSGSPGLFAVCTEAEAKSAAADINAKGWRTDDSHLIASGALRGLYVFQSANETRSYRAGGSGGGF